MLCPQRHRGRWTVGGHAAILAKYYYRTIGLRRLQRVFRSDINTIYIYTVTDSFRPSAELYLSSPRRSRNFGNRELHVSTCTSCIAGMLRENRKPCRHCAVEKVPNKKVHYDTVSSGHSNAPFWKKLYLRIVISLIYIRIYVETVNSCKHLTYTEVYFFLYIEII